MRGRARCAAPRRGIGASLPAASDSETPTRSAASITTATGMPDAPRGLKMPKPKKKKLPEKSPNLHYSKAENERLRAGLVHIIKAYRARADTKDSIELSDPKKEAQRLLIMAGQCLAYATASRELESLLTPTPKPQTSETVGAEFIRCPVIGCTRTDTHTHETVYTSVRNGLCGKPVGHEPPCGER